MDLRETIRTVPNWPIHGVMFRDITTLMQNPAAFRYACDQFYQRYRDREIDKVVGIDARGFIFGAVLAYQLGVGFVPVRKKGKLPFTSIAAEYSLEYGTSTVEMHADSVQEGERVLIVDDLIATGGTIAATINLIERLGGKVLECAFVVELPELRGREKIQGYEIFTLTHFEGE